MILTLILCLLSACSHYIQTMNQDKLVFCTFNSRGHANDRVEYIKHLMCKCDILLLQEHWCFEANLPLLEAKIENVNIIGISGMDEDKIQSGRPYGGCAFVYKKNMKCSIEPIVTKSKRLCACILRIADGVSIMTFNVYMPCDTYHDQSNLTEYNEVNRDMVRFMS